MQFLCFRIRISSKRNVNSDKQKRIIKKWHNHWVDKFCSRIFVINLQGYWTIFLHLSFQSYKNAKFLNNAYFKFLNPKLICIQKKDKHNGPFPLISFILDLIISFLGISKQKKHQNTKELSFGLKNKSFHIFNPI